MFPQRSKRTHWTQRKRPERMGVKRKGLCLHWPDPAITDLPTTLYDHVRKHWIRTTILQDEPIHVWLLRSKDIKIVSGPFA